MNLRQVAGVGASWLALTGVALAQQAPATADAQRAETIQELEARLAAIEAQLNDLKASTAADSADIRRIQTTAPQVTLANGRPTFATADNAFKAAIRGVAQFDVAHYDQDAPTGVDNRRSDAANPGDLNSGTNFRRARIGIEGTAFRDWNYAITGEFGGSGVETPVLNQAYIEYAGWKPFANIAPLRFRIGAWATPTGLEDATSNTEQLFLERPAAAELVRNIAGGDGRSGVGVFANSDHFYGSAVFTGSIVGQATDFDEQTGYLLRVAALPIHGDGYGFHIGANAAGVIDPADTNAGVADTQVVRLRERPELRVDAERFVDTGSLAADGVTAYGLEAGGYWNNFYATGEFFQIDVSRSGGIADPQFNGWYAQAAWTLTGEKRKWVGANGGFQGIRPNNAFDLTAGHWGAWEIAARYSELDLNDGEGALGTAPSASAVRGGEQQISTVGLNWYPNNAIRFLLDYQHVEIDRLDPEVTATIVTAVPGVGAQLGQDYDVISFRSQFAF